MGSRLEVVLEMKNALEKYSVKTDEIINVCKGREFRVFKV